LERISSLGVGSGLDLNSLVTQLVTAERAPAENRLNREQAKAQTQLSAFGALKSAAAKLQDVLDDLSGFRTAMQASSSLPDVIAASAGSGAEPGRYRLQVSQLASAQSLASAVFADADAAVGEGVLQISVGDTVVDIEVGGDVVSLRDVRDAINASDAPVQAIVVADGGGYRLLLTAQETGADTAMTLTVDGTLDANLASAAMTETATASNAVYTINGLALESASNDLDTLVPGVSLSLRGLTEGADSVEIVVEPDRAALSEKLDALVQAYNALVDVIGATGRVDPGGSSAGPLVGNAALRSLQSRISGVFSAPVVADADTGALSSLLDLGFRTDASGKVSLDPARLEAAAAGNDDAVAALVAGFAGGLSATLEGYAGSEGLLDLRTAGLNDRLRQVARQREALDARMEQVEERLRRQFTALDALVAQFQSTSGFLDNQLSMLAALRPGNGKD
jgi:flagellar hook-associated protein 2